MIKNGNYEFLNFDEVKDQLVDAIVEFHEGKYKNIITEKINSIVYLPFLRPKNIYKYYNQLITKYKDEVIAEFTKLTGYPFLSPKISNIVWSKEESYSPLLQCIQDGDSLETMPTLDPKNKEKLLQCREDLYKFFNLKGEDRFAQLQNLARLVKKAIKKVEENHPCDVFNDINKYEQNKLTALQMFLTSVVKTGYSFTDKDKEIINNPNIDVIDVVNLDSYNILFNKHVGNQGLYFYFTAECEEIINQNTDLFYVEEILKGRLYFWMLMYGDEICNSFKYITMKELTEETSPKERKSIIGKLIKELDELPIEKSEMKHVCSYADVVEGCRERYTGDLYSGCKFASYVQYYNTGETDLFKEPIWITYTENKYSLKDQVNYILFDESDLQSVNNLINNLIHEVYHVIRRGATNLDKTGKTAVESFGISLNTRKFEDGRVSDYCQIWDENVLQLEENINERMSKEISDIFIKKYPNPYKESDLNCKDDEPFVVYYDLYNFITEKFYSTYKEYLKESPFQEENGLYYSNEQQPLTIKDFIKQSITSKAKRILTPNAFSEKGRLDFYKVDKLSGVITDFEMNVRPFIEDYEILSFEDLNDKSLDKLPTEIRWYMEDLKRKGENVCKDMSIDETQLRRYRRLLNTGKVKSGYGNAIMYTMKENMKNIGDKGVSLVTNITDKIKNKKKINDYKKDNLNLTEVKDSFDKEM